MSNATPATTVNKVCASGMKATMIGFDSIKAETNEMVITGGQESLSNTPFVLGRNAPAYGGDKIKGIGKNLCAISIIIALSISLIRFDKSRWPY